MTYRLCAIDSTKLLTHNHVASESLRQKGVGNSGALFLFTKPDKMQNIMAVPPKYTHESTIEHQILADAEVFFAERDEKLRFELVKRVFQWMLDTDDNGWFEGTEAHKQRQGRRASRIRSGEWEMQEYLRLLQSDTYRGHLTGEVDALYEYISSLEQVLRGADGIPTDYEKRRLMIQDTLNPLERYDRILRPLTWLTGQGDHKSL